MNFLFVNGMFKNTQKLYKIAEIFCWTLCNTYGEKDSPICIKYKGECLKGR